MKEIIFACFAAPGEGAKEALLLARSIRQFAGHMRNSVIWVLISEMEPLKPEFEAYFRSLDVQLIPFLVTEEAHSLPFAAKVFAAAEAEVVAEGVTANLVWMDRDSIVVQEPGALRLPQGKVLGYRPVDHTLIGSPYDQPIDGFWQMVYQRCDVPAAKIFPMIASVDEQKIRPYFNAGMLVVRPERGLLRSWARNFEKVYLAADFEPFYEKDVLYRIFIHQAILAGTILAACWQEALFELSYLINYPLHMHKIYPAGRRPAKINDLISCRYDTFFQDAEWQAKVLIDEPLKSWLREQSEFSK